MFVSWTTARRSEKLERVDLKRPACIELKTKQEQELRDAKPRRLRRTGTKRGMVDGLVIKTDECKYSEVLKAMPNSRILEP